MARGNSNGSLWKGEPSRTGGPASSGEPCPCHDFPPWRILRLQLGAQGTATGQAEHCEIVICGSTSSDVLLVQALIALVEADLRQHVDSI